LKSTRFDADWKVITVRVETEERIKSFFSQKEKLIIESMEAKSESDICGTY
jgi:hypothetical protein